MAESILNDYKKRFLVEYNREYPLSDTMPYKIYKNVKKKTLYSKKKIGETS